MEGIPLCQDVFPPQFPQLKTLLRRQTAEEERRSQLYTEMHSLKLALSDSEERVRQISQELAEATTLRVAARPAESLTSVIDAVLVSLGFIQLGISQQLLHTSGRKFLYSEPVRGHAGSSAGRAQTDGRQGSNFEARFDSRKTSNFLTLLL